MNRVQSIRPLLLHGSLLLLAAGLAGCKPDTSIPKPSETALAARPTATASLEATIPVTESPAELFTDTECLDCHTDQDTLKELAVEEVQTASLSEGPG